MSKPAIKLERSPSPYTNMLQESRVKPHGFVARTMDVQIPSGKPFKDILDHGYWKQCAAQLKPMDMLIVYSDDAAFWARLLVLDSQPGIGANVRVLEVVDLDKASNEALPTKADEYEIRHKGFAKWCVIRISDGVKVSQGHETEQEARGALPSIIKTAMA